MACEKCWNDAYLRMLVNGKSQSENYRDLLEERKDNPCGPEWESDKYFKGSPPDPTRECCEFTVDATGTHHKPDCRDPGDSDSTMDYMGKLDYLERKAEEVTRG